MRYGIIPRTTKVDNTTLEINESGEIQIKGGAVSTELIAKGSSIPRKYIYNPDGTEIDYIQETEIEKSGASQTWVEFPEFTMNIPEDLGSQRVQAEVTTSGSGSYARIKKNGDVIRNISFDSGWQDLSEVTELNEGDQITFELQRFGGGTLRARKGGIRADLTPTYGIYSLFDND